MLQVRDVIPRKRCRGSIPRQRSIALIPDQIPWKGTLAVQPGDRLDVAGIADLEDLHSGKIETRPASPQSPAKLQAASKRGVAR